MKRIVVVFLTFILCQSFTKNEETGLKIIIKPVFGNSVFSIDSFYSSHKCGRVKIDRLKFYISGISLYKSGSLVFNDSDFYLLDASDFSSFSLPVNIPSDLQYDKVKFNVGVDSLTNVSGAMGGNLDPAKGMYWTWQSGYINCKIEGTCSNCQTRNNEFQLHLGGYSEPFNCLQRMEFQHNPNSKNIQLELDLKKFIETSYLSVHPNVMSPNVEAVRLSALFKSCFSISKQ